MSYVPLFLCLLVCVGLHDPMKSRMSDFSAALKSEVPVAAHLSTSLEQSGVLPSRFVLKPSLQHVLPLGCEGLGRASSVQACGKMALSLNPKQQTRQPVSSPVEARTESTLLYSTRFPNRARAWLCRGHSHQGSWAYSVVKNKTKET